MNAPVDITVPSYRHAPLFPLGKDSSPYRKLTGNGVRLERLVGRSSWLSSPRLCARWRRRRSPISTICCGRATSRSCASILEDPRGERQRQVRRLRFPEERQYRGRAACFPCARIPAPPSSWARRDDLSSPTATTRQRSPRARATPTQAQSALFAARAAFHVRGEEHQIEHAGAGRDLCRRARARTTAYNSCSSPRAGARPTSLSVPGDAVDSPHDRMIAFLKEKCSRSAPPPARPTISRSSSEAPRPN